MHAKLEQWMNWIEYDELMEGKHNSPHHLLGVHDFLQGRVFTAYRPTASAIWVVDRASQQQYPMEAIEDKGFFGLFLEDQKLDDYQLRVQYGEDDIILIDDPYRFEPVITDLDMHLFAEGNHYSIYEKLGAHPMTIDGTEGTYFAVWAPHARRVSVVGDFNMWDGRLHPMRVMGVSGICELFLPGVKPGHIYKYEIMTRTGDILLKADPYANYAEVRPGNASRICDCSKSHWTDGEWMKERATRDRNAIRREAMSIYEVHPGSWKKKQDGTEDGFYTYRELADTLGNYLLEMQYTHVELMGIAEHPFDGSWGYQVTGYYAPTSRYGQPEDFAYFVDRMHSKGIQVILDWVPAHFPKDEHGLARFDGMPLYEHADPRRGEHPHWGTYIFDYGKNEVENFLIANALFWLKEYHIDALRVDAVASMLYLDYGKEDGEWLPNDEGGNENKEVVALLRKLNTVVERYAPGTMMIAEESTAWAGVTAPAKDQGLGFLYKWNMGWMNDFLEYMKLDPLFRGPNHHRLCFSLMYAYSENFVLVLSHDEVVHGKCSLLNKMPGMGRDKYANLRTAFGFMYGHPGKKLLFMGQEFAQEREWSEARELDWNLLSVNEHQMMQEYVKALNTLYCANDSLYYNDCEEIGFQWMTCDRADDSVVAFVRRGSTTKHQLLFICNFTPVPHTNYMIPAPCSGNFMEVLSSDEVRFGGNGVSNGLIQAKKVPCDNSEYSLTFDLPPLSCVVFEYDYVKG